jgi:microcystin-dependent protein
MMDGTTIGSASSGATGRANADTQNLFTLLWNSFSNTNAPVSGGRGASASADWSANKTIQVPDGKGKVIAGVDAGGTTLSIGTVIGNTGGAQTHTLSIAEMPAHNHDVTDPSHTHGGVGYSSQGVQGSTMQTMMEPYNATVAAAYTGITIQNKGGGGAHNNVQPTLVMNYIIKL